MKRNLLIVVMILSSTIIFSQNIPNMFNSGYSLSNLGSLSFKKPNNLHISNSASFSSTFNSSSKKSSYLSNYSTNFLYDVNPKLKLNLKLNFANFGTANYNSNFEFSGNNDNTSKVLPEFSLDYKPFENTSIHIEFRQNIGNSPFSRSFSNFDRRYGW